uniref:Uncharacterized protein n=1 Tax=Nelumbo nucifera TaxID=4432 RepID=A0A822Y046_NELNU|nr:TPA_asm: hypothetical protein HUJ06_027305 [Nelumbo nucifera]
MAHNRCSGSLTSPRVDVLVDTGNTFLDHTVDGFLKIGAVAATRAAAEETFQCLGRGHLPCSCFFFFFFFLFI